MRVTSLSTLGASWERLVNAHGGMFTRTSEFVAARSRHAVFNNVLLLRANAAAIDAIRRFYAGADTWALWAGDTAGDELAARAGLVANGGTTDMACLLDVLPKSSGESVASADPGVVSVINGLPAELLAGAPGFSGLVAGNGAAAVLLFRHADDVHLSFLATRPEHRRKGLATRLVAAALHQARKEGAKTATLQSTPAAVSLYEGAGFRPIGRWTEWTDQPSVSLSSG